MRSFKILVHRVLYGVGRPREYEMVCIRAVRDRLSSAAKSILDSNIEIRGWVQRGLKDKEVVFGWLDPTDEERLLRFPNRSDALYFARVELVGSETELVRADLIIHDGLLFSLEFSHPPRSDLKLPVEVRDVRILADVMEPGSAPAQMQSGGDLAEFLPKMAVTGALLPASEGTIRAFEERICAGIPRELRELLAVTDGFEVDGWTFHGTRAQRWVYPDYNLWVLADNAPTSIGLCLREGDRDGTIYAYDQLETRLVQIRRGFIEALETAVSHPERLFAREDGHPD